MVSSSFLPAWSLKTADILGERLQVAWGEEPQCSHSLLPGWPLREHTSPSAELLERGKGRRLVPGALTELTLLDTQQRHWGHSSEEKRPVPFLPEFTGNPEG